MPNWCENEIQISLGENKEKAKKELKKFCEIYDDKKSKQGFLSLYFPMPESLMIESSNVVDYGIAILLSENHNNHEKIDEINSYNWAKEFTREELIENIKKSYQLNLEQSQKAIDNEKKYGFKNWYQWSIANWGTKWDLNVISFLEKNNKIYIIADSAWSPPIEAFEKISEDFPNLIFNIKYKEEGNGIRGKVEICCGESYSNN